MTLQRFPFSVSSFPRSSPSQLFRVFRRQQTSTLLNINVCYLPKYDSKPAPRMQPSIELFHHRSPAPATQPVLSGKAEIEDILEIDELRGRIFANLEKTTLAKCARVCTLWSDDALNLIWKKLDSVVPLISTIFPLTGNVRSALTRCNAYIF